MSSTAREASKRFAKRSRAGVIAGRIAVERSRDLRRMMGRRDGPMGATHQRFELEGGLEYIDRVFSDYLTYGSLGPADLEGARILELGPGDNLGVALRFAAAGAAEVVATDRFIPYRDHDYERRVYEALVDRLPEEERARVAPALTEAGFSLDGVPIEFHQQTPIEEAPELLGESRFDLIVSRAVLEHVHDLETAFAAMDRLLKPGGRMIHKVDLADHGLFTGGGQNPLTFLTISDRVYGWMGEESAGLPNREMIGWYQRKMDSLGYEADYLITHLAGVEVEIEPHPPLADGLPASARLDYVEEIRPKLLERFRSLSDLELSIAGFMLIARKPSG